MIALTRRYWFPAAHVLRQPALSDAENHRLYGKCSNPHGHHYGVEVTVAGPVDEESGCVVEPEALDAVVRDRVLDRFAHRNLNDDALFERVVPTAENLALAIHARIEEPVANLGAARVVRVRVLETRRNSFDCGELS